MQQRRRTRRQIIVSNLLWLIGSLALGIFVWIVAVTGDGQERRFTAVPIQVEHNEGLVIVDQQTRTTRVTVRAPQDVLGLLTAEDIVVRADLTEVGPGTHTVELEAIISRSLVLADTQPRQITVVLEEILAQQVPITASITAAPPLNYENSQPAFSEAQVLASGPASRVQQVAAARAIFDLTGQREGLEAQVRLSPVDLDGNVVEGVTLEPQTVTAVVEIRRRDGLEEVSVSPDIAINTLPSGYVISSILYDPSTVFVIGSPDALENTPNTLITETIDLTNHTDDFEIEVPVILPGAGPDLSLIGGDTIRVSVRIDAQTTNIQLENVPIMVIGLDEHLEAELSPLEVNALITGPLPLLSGLTSESIRVTVDLTGLTAGTYEIDAFATLNQEGIFSVSLLPPSIQVVISQAVQQGTPPPP